MEGAIGRIFHMETLGAADGPGLRLVLFMQGCPLRCPYCHNPEGWALDGGREITVDEVMERLRRYKSYYADGGLTLSGGEPLMQALFAEELFARCRGEGVHTALDTSACVSDEDTIRACEAADLILLDIKDADPARHRAMFGFSQEGPLSLLRRCEAWGKPVWARHVVVPGVNDSPEDMERLRALLLPFSCVERVELLPFRKLCLEKYEQMGIPFPLAKSVETGETPPFSWRAK